MATGVDGGNLTRPERALWAASGTGKLVDLRTGDPEQDDAGRGASWGPDRTVRASVITALLLGAGAAEPGHVPAVRLARARISGRLQAAHASIGLPLELEGCHLEAAPEFTGADTRAIALVNCHLPGFEGNSMAVRAALIFSGSVILGRISLPNARVGGLLLLNGAHLTVPGDWALSGGGLAVEGGMFGRGCTVQGAVRLVGARLRGGLYLEDAKLANPGGVALQAANLITPQVELSQGFTAEGAVRLRGARVDGTLSLDEAVLLDRDVALHGVLMQAEELILAPAEPVEGMVTLAYSRIGLITGDPRIWPARTVLNGLEYDRLRGTDSLRDRLDWVARDPAGYRPQPYEQLASWYRRIGQENQARRVLLARQRARQATLRPAGRAWSRLLDWTVGHGYQPWRAALWFAALLAVGTTVFGLHPPAPLHRGDAPHFNPFVYTLDLLIPVGLFGQRDAWNPSGTEQWLGVALVTAGWILATALVAGVTRVLNRD